MSKLDKNIQDARSWVKKHAEATEAVAVVTAALTTWEGKIQALAKAKSDLEATKKATIGARKSVGEAVKQAKKSLVKPKVPKKPAETKKPAEPKKPTVAKKTTAKKAPAKVSTPAITKPQS